MRQKGGVPGPPTRNPCPRIHRRPSGLPTVTVQAPRLRGRPRAVHRVSDTGLPSDTGRPVLLTVKKHVITVTAPNKLACTHTRTGTHTHTHTHTHNLHVLYAYTPFFCLGYRESVRDPIRSRSAFVSARVSDIQVPSGLDTLLLDLVLIIAHVPSRNVTQEPSMNVSLRAN